MSNPFEKRATEYLRDDAAFLAVVTPEPLSTFFEKHAKSGALFDRLCMIIGTPGSGKTTIATLVQFKTVHALLNSPNHTEYRVLQDALTRCKIIEGNIPRVLGCRIPMESEYREFWELPYSEEIKVGLLKSFLQSRSMILWLKSLKNSNSYNLKDVTIVYREGAGVAKNSIGGTNAEQVLAKAKEIEKSMYEIFAALVPPSVDSLPSISIQPYHPFDAIESIIAKKEGTDESTSFRPLVMLDDVHSLHPKQLFCIRDWLARREMRISRWMLMRFDAQTPESILNQGVSLNSGLDQETTIKKSREITFIWLQGNEDRAANRKKFRIMARSMADKYLRLMPVLHKRGFNNFQNLLNTQSSPISESNFKKLQNKVDNFQKKCGITQKTRKSLADEIDRYFSTAINLSGDKDLKLAMLHILLNRYVKRVPQANLFDELDPEDPPEPTKPITADSDIADGARVFLLHEFKRPYYYGIDAVCDGSSENAEQFLQLAGRLANASETRVISGSEGTLSASYQNRLLIEKAAEIIHEWAFPKHQEVKRLCSYIADQCVSKSLEPNAPLGGGANALGVPDNDFENIWKNHPELAQALKFGVAYNALSIKRGHKTKNRLWALIELTGPVLIVNGLTFTRGGFLEKQIQDLANALELE
ncbi:MAG: hypothetical protein KC643_02965 [Nitrospira sp.]|nr:hypothetical protein [Nitrospira sp.]